MERNTITNVGALTTEEREALLEELAHSPLAIALRVARAAQPFRTSEEAYAQFERSRANRRQRLSPLSSLPSKSKPRYNRPMAALLAFAGTDSPAPRVYPMAPGGIRYQTFQPPSYKSDYLLSMDFATTPLRKPDAVGSWLDDLIGDAGGSAVATATDTVTASIVAQIPAITAAVLASPAYQAEAAKLKQQAALGGLVLGALVVGGVWAVLR